MPEAIAKAMANASGQGSGHGGGRSSGCSAGRRGGPGRGRGSGHGGGRGRDTDQRGEGRHGLGQCRRSYFGRDGVARAAADDAAEAPCDGRCRRQKKNDC